MPFKNNNPGCCCTCNWTFTVKGCDNALLASYVVNLRQSGVLIGTGTTNGSGVTTIDVPAGNYDVEIVPAVGSVYATYTSSGVAHTCAQSTTITLTNNRWRIFANGCNSQGIPGVFIELFQSGVSKGSATSDASGMVEFYLPAGTYDAVATPSGNDFDVTSVSLSHSCPGTDTDTITLGFDTGTFTCKPCSKYPVPLALHFADDEGDHDFVYVAGSGVWAINAAAGIGSYPITGYNFVCTPGSSVEVTVSFVCNATPSMTVNWVVRSCGGTDVWSEGGLGGVGAGVSGSFVSMTENPFSITFNLPTQEPDTAHGGNRPVGNTDPGWDTPGGGGLITITG